MIVLYVHIHGAVFVPPEGDAVVGAQSDRVTPRPVALQGVEVRAGIVHVLGPFGGFQRRQDSPQLSNPLAVQALRLTPGPVVPERLVPNASNRDGKVTAASGIVK